MRRGLAISAILAMLSVAPAFSQHHGGGGGFRGGGGFHAGSGFRGGAGGGFRSGGSGFGGAFAGGFRGSSARGWHGPGFASGGFGFGNGFRGPGFRRPGFFPNRGFGSGRFFGPRFFSGYPWWFYGSVGAYYADPGYYGYYADPGYYGYGYTSSADYDSAPPPTPAAYMNQGGMQQGQVQPDQVQQNQIDRLQDQVDRLRDERDIRYVPRPPTASRSEASVERQAATVLVFHDKHTQEVRNYAVVGQTVWIFNEQRATKLPLSSLDLPATTRANEDRGIDFRVPE
jgi:hypothetical protein